MEQKQPLQTSRQKKKTPVRYRLLLLFILLLILFAACAAFLAIGKAPEPAAGTGGTSAAESTEAAETSAAAAETVPAVSEESTEATVAWEDRVDTTLWNLILVNAWNVLPADFTVKTASLDNGLAVDARIRKELQQMLNDADDQGMSLVVCSAYRTLEKQTVLYNLEVKKYVAQGYTTAEAEQQAAVWVAVPGTSEHQTGLALDIAAKSYQELDRNQENTPEQQWLMANSWKYGFVLRYPNEKSGITDIGYEPWHYRYVGREAAEVIHEENLCLEEYLQKYGK